MLKKGELTIEQLVCTIHNIIFRNGDNGYSVLEAKDSSKKTVTVIGLLADVTPGTILTAEGEWKTDAKYGPQFAASKWTTELPHDSRGIERYLATFTKGVGEKYAQRIVEHFGCSAIQVLDNTPERLKEIRGLGAKRIAKIQKSWAKQKHIQDIMIFLQGHDITAGLATKIYNQYGPDSINAIKKNPYRLADEVRGIGFSTADELAMKMGVPKESDNRLRSGIRYALTQISGEGHVFAKYHTLITKAANLLAVDNELVEASLKALISEGTVIQEDDAIYLRPLFYAEAGIGKHLKRLMTKAKSLSMDIQELEKLTGMSYDSIQADAILTAMEEKVMVLTGGPGTGKTTTTKGIIAAFQKYKLDIVLAAPTGRAAKRMKETTGLEALTIHRLLEYNPETGWGRDSENPIDGDVLIVDEASMIDTFLMSALLRAAPSNMRVILVGDIDQLPSVGPGNVLQDIICSGVIPTTRLSKIFRQAQCSKIITNCHLVNEGNFPSFTIKKDSDYFFITDNDAEHIKIQIVDLVSHRLPKAYGVNPTEIQVLAPQKTSVIGTRSLNTALQAALNPSPISIISDGTTFKVNDKVMQMQNNYDKGVFNGDIGFIQKIDPDDGQVIIDFDGRAVEYEQKELYDVSLAYATTIHKSQGSEYPVVIVPIHNTNHVMLERHLIYTAMSRAKKLLVIIGSKEAFLYAVKHETTTQRNTRLKERLLEDNSITEA